MVLYKFYWRDETGDEHFVGVRAERRKSQERITRESILNWGRQIAGIDFPHVIYFVAAALRFLTSGTAQK